MLLLGKIDFNQIIFGVALLGAVLLILLISDWQKRRFKRKYVPKDMRLSYPEKRKQKPVSWKAYVFGIPIYVLILVGVGFLARNPAWFWPVIKWTGIVIAGLVAIWLTRYIIWPIAMIKLGFAKFTQVTIQDDDSLFFKCPKCLSDSTIPRNDNGTYPRIRCTACRKALTYYFAKKQGQ